MGLKYSPNAPPYPQDQELIQIVEYLILELHKISQVLDQVTDGHLEELNEEPNKPNDEMVRNADGIGWDPSGGASTTASAKGLYWYTGSAWKKIIDSA